MEKRYALEFTGYIIPGRPDDSEETMGNTGHPKHFYFYVHLGRQYRKYCPSSNLEKSGSAHCQNRISGQQLFNCHMHLNPVYYRPVLYRKHFTVITNERRIIINAIPHHDGHYRPAERSFV
jgi:hypothetical protein